MSEYFSNITKVVLGISGGIAAYKTPEIVRQLKKQGISTSVLLTKAAGEFVTKLSLGTVSGSPPIDDLFAYSSGVTHIEIEKNAELMIIAPATANIIAKLAQGIADDIVSTVFLAFNGPKLIVPAMNSQMWNNPITQSNIQKLKSYGVDFLGPDKGFLACGAEDIGRMVSPELIVKKVMSINQVSSQLNLKNKRILITAGGTRERLDKVRVLTNLSSGKLGQQLAHSAAFYGAEVTLITTTEIAENPEIKKIIKVESVAELDKAVKEEIINHDTLFMAAAVADYTVKEVQNKKIKRQDTLNLELIGTPDILKEITPLKKDKTFIGFCLEENDLENVALAKLKRKNLDYIIANKPASIGKDKRDVIILADNYRQEITGASLPELAYQLLSLLNKEVDR